MLPGYVVILNHILPGLDDGSRTFNESLLLAKAMVTVGYDTVIATPHTFEGKLGRSYWLARPPG